MSWDKYAGFFLELYHILTHSFHKTGCQGNGNILPPLSTISQRALAKETQRQTLTENTNDMNCDWVCEQKLMKNIVLPGPRSGIVPCTVRAKSLLHVTSYASCAIDRCLPVTMPTLSGGASHFPQLPQKRRGGEGGAILQPKSD